ncbi:nuclear transport factor 2 family protein [Nocardioides caldifontis]|uniref:nuclear transport factor 2 family protein n=1 Tax=Nocardioides caldifontis TaxID=2588938 RepID=UPI001396CF1F|nr:nuclear transport factor 2 family protein [Nocardioides caldifontis]
MADQTPARTFADALLAFESGGDVDELAALFADGAELVRPEASGLADPEDAAGFWTSYRDQFDEVTTEFGHVTEGEDHATLEWSSSGSLTTERSITYRGVSLLHLDGDGRIDRFATYYDTAAFLEPSAR